MPWLFHSLLLKQVSSSGEMTGVNETEQGTNYPHDKVICLC
jgi:hypothetical protein